MSEAEINKIYDDTQDYILGLKSNLLDKHLANPLASPDEYDLDVKSYCILSHAAFEDFIESISLKVMEICIENYTVKRKFSESIISLLHFKSSAGIKYINKLDEKTPIVNTFDYVRKELVEIKSSFSQEIVHNHGVSIKYIRQLLMPIAIDITNDDTILDSLKQLASERGFYAHRFLERGTVKRSIEPEKAVIIVEDCLLLCLDIRDKAKNRII